MKMLETLKILSELPGVSGNEHAVREEICKQLEGHCDYHVDALGNVIAYKKGKNAPKNTMLFSAHMDEVGFIITYIQDNGLLRFQNVGGVDTRVSFGKAVEVGPKRLPGVIGAKATHLLTPAERLVPAKVDDMVIDIGAATKEEAEQVVQLGDRAVFYSPFQTFGENHIVGKALDDRAGCTMLLDLAQSELAYDCVFSFTVMEENGCIGGTTAAYQVNPAIGVAIETTTASDIGGVPREKHVCRQGEGAAISFADRGTIYDRELYQLVFETAQKNNIPCQAKEGSYGGNEGRVIQTARSGARTLTMSLPCRYLHSPTNVLNTKDIQSMRQLLEAMISELANL